jgi:hypothetical protein
MILQNDFAFRFVEKSRVRLISTFHQETPQVKPAGFLVRLHHIAGHDEQRRHLETFELRA